MITLSLKGGIKLKNRIKQLRKELKLTQDDFGYRLGITGSAISKLESGASGITEQLIKSICKEFNVDYIWLTTGQNEMFVKQSFDDMAIVDNIINTFMNNESEFAKNVFKMFSKYTLEDWKALEQIVSKSAEYMDAIKKGE